MIMDNNPVRKDMAAEKIAESHEGFINGFETALCDDDNIFSQDMKTDNLPDDGVQKYRLWEWTQGAKPPGLRKRHKENRDGQVAAILYLPEAGNVSLGGRQNDD